MAAERFNVQLGKEMEQYEMTMTAAPKTPLETFGHPMAPCVIDGKTYEVKTARYSFWPANKERLPLLFICASIILSAPATSTSNEGFHSIVTLLLRPNRRSMSKKRVQGYSLMRASLRATLKTKFGKAIDDIESEALKSGYLDVAEVREVLGLSDDVRFDDDTISDSDSNSGSDNDDLIDCMSN